jgi:hypothetical protein
MIGESFYYINNKKYIGKSSAMTSAISESPFNGDQTRTVKIVMPDEHLAVEQSYEDALHADYPRASAGMIEYANLSDVDTIEYLGNTNKEYLLFENATEFLEFFAKYTASLLRTTTEHDVKQVTKDFIKLVTSRDNEYSTLSNYSTVDIDAAVEAVYTANVFYEFTGPVTSKWWGYDILFFINDRYNRDATYEEINLTTTKHLREKFTVHSETMINEVITMLQSKIGYISVINNIIDWFTAQGDTTWNKTQFIQDTFQNKNRMMALYSLRDFWVAVGDNAVLMDLINNHEEWEYEEVYKEFAKTIPIVVQIAEGGFNFASNEQLRSAWSEVEFFYKRKARIPYLLFKILPLVPE